MQKNRLLKRQTLAELSTYVVGLPMSVMDDSHICHFRHWRHYLVFLYRMNHIISTAKINNNKKKPNKSQIKIYKRKITINKWLICKCLGFGFEWFFMDMWICGNVNVNGRSLARTHFICHLKNNYQLLGKCSSSV